MIPGFSAERALDPKGRAEFKATYRYQGGAERFVPQGCSIGKWLECGAQAASCAAICASGNIPGCVACGAALAANCGGCV